MIQYVAQENENGCTVACVAMVLGVSYREARALFGSRDIERHGCTCNVYDSVLIEAGFALGWRYWHDTIANKKRDVWPTGPFAPVHIVTVMASQGAHAVVMLADGEVLDPFDRSRTSLQHPAYLEIHRIAGVWKVAS